MGIDIHNSSQTTAQPGARSKPAIWLALAIALGLHVLILLLQRLGDKITPEFGWITKYGTEVKCIWVLGRPTII